MFFIIRKIKKRFNKNKDNTTFNVEVVFKYLSMKFVFSVFSYFNYKVTKKLSLLNIKNIY